MAQKRVNSKVAAENEQKEQQKKQYDNDQPDNFGRFGANTQRTNIS